MSCEIYNNLTDNSLLSGTGPSCQYEKGCPKTPDNCKWAPLLRQAAHNMALLDTNEDLAQDKVLAELEEKAKHETLAEDAKLEDQIKSLVSISRVN
ncbi:MAG TPA: hypothetical protein VKC54_00410 [Patescibacteria group bacterium]|nr:hypothetical protein [Patescibacteria group bacterium]